MGGKRLPGRADVPGLADGYYWFRDPGGPPGGWQVARVVGGRVERFGSGGRAADDLGHAVWVRAEPPGGHAGEAAAAGAWRVRVVAEGIVNAFLGVQGPAGPPGRREEMVATIISLIDRVRG